MDESLLGNSQTYIGVLATFVVLCLFAARNNETSNFIIFTILKIAEESISHIDQHIEELKQGFSSVWNAKSQGDENLKKFVDSINDPDTKAKLSEKAVDIKLVPYDFNDEARKLADSYQPNEVFKNKEELPYISLFTLLLIILVMFLDCLCVMPLAIRCRFVNFLFVLSTFYVFVLYHKFLNDRISDNKSKTNDKPNRFFIFGGLFIAIAIWSVLSLVVISPLIDYVLLWSALGLWLGFSKRRWIKLAHYFEKYNRRFVIKHFVYLVLFSIVCVALSSLFQLLIATAGLDEVYLNNWRNNTAIFYNVELARYFAIAFFTLNSIVLPLFMGYCFLYMRERTILKKIGEIQQLYTDINEKHLKEFDIMKTEAKNKRAKQPDV